MKIMKSLLAAVMAICLVACLAVPAFAEPTEGTTAATETTAAATEATAEATTDATEGATEGTEPVESEGATEETEGTVEEDDTVTTGAEEEHDHDHEEDEAGEPEKTGVLETILIVLEMIASIILVIVVLLQSGKESGLSSSISGNSDSYMSKSGKGGLDKTLAKSTKWVALVWVALTLALSLL